MEAQEVREIVQDIGHHSVPRAIQIPLTTKREGLLHGDLFSKIVVVCKPGIQNVSI